MKHNQYERGHNTIKDKDEASIACWYRNLKGIRYCPLIMEAIKINLIVSELLEVHSENKTKEKQKLLNFPIKTVNDNGT